MPNQSRVAVILNNKWQSYQRKIIYFWFFSSFKGFHKMIILKESQQLLRIFLMHQKLKDLKGQFMK